MRSRLVSALAVLGAVTVLVLAANTVALATTGRGFLLGQVNQTAKLTTLDRITTGPALRLQTKNDDSAPFSTNATGKVKNLDADTVDGLDSKALRNAQTVDGLDSKALRDATTLQGLQPYEIERAALDNHSAYEALNYAQVQNWSTADPATSATVDIGNQYGTRLATYNVVLTGASGRTSCRFGQVTGPPTGSGIPSFSDRITTSDGTSPGISGVGVVSGGNHDSVLLKCDSQTPFTVDGVITTFMTTG